MKITKLLQGYARYRAGHYPNHSDLLKNLSEHGQHPKVAFITCCDSRIDPVVLTDSVPGDLFIIRNVASLVPPCVVMDKVNCHGTSAAVEYAVCGLEVEHIVVMGHAQCGGIHALLTGQGVVEGGGFVESWMKIAAGAKERALCGCGGTAPADGPTEEQARVGEQTAIKISLENLMTFPWVQKRVKQGTLVLHGWYYNLALATLSKYDPETDEFHPIEV